MAKFTKQNAKQFGSRGGKATMRKYGNTHMRQIAKRGFRVMVQKHYGGDVKQALNTLIARGLMAQDPMPQNRAWTKDRIPDRLPATYDPSRFDEDIPY